MILQVQPFFGHPKHLSKTDSLEIAMRAMQTKMDSLTKIVHKTEIGTSFFSDALSQNLYFYTAILSAVALLSWGWVAKTMHFHQKTVKRHTDKTIASIKDEFTLKTDSLNLVLKSTNYDVNRAIFLIARREERNHSNEIRWALSALQAYIFMIENPENKYTSNDIEMINNWIGAMEITCKRLTEKDPKIISAQEKLQSYIKYILNHISDDKMLKRMRAIEAELNHIIYSKPDSSPMIDLELENNDDLPNTTEN